MNNVELMWTVKEATQDELRRVYAKKPKDILILDCAYLESERLNEMKAKREAEHQNAQLRAKVSGLESKLITLGMVNGKLTEAITMLRDMVVR